MVRIASLFHGSQLGENPRQGAFPTRVGFDGVRLEAQPDAPVFRGLRVLRRQLARETPEPEISAQRIQQLQRQEMTLEGDRQRTKQRSVAEFQSPVKLF